MCLDTGKHLYGSVIVNYLRFVNLKTIILYFKKLKSSSPAYSIVELRRILSASPKNGWKQFGQRLRILQLVELKLNIEWIELNSVF